MDAPCKRRRILHVSGKMAELRKKQSLMFRGRILGPDAKPLARTEMRVEWSSLVDPGIESSFFPPPYSSFGKVFLTGKNGEFSLHFPMPDEKAEQFRLKFFSPDTRLYAACTFPTGRFRKVINLGKVILRDSPVLVSARLLKEDGNPLSFLKVSLISPPWFCARAHYFRAVKTDAKGWFKVYGIPTKGLGHVELRIPCDTGFYLRHEIPWDSKNRENLVLTVHRAPRIQGRAFMPQEVDPRDFTFRLYWHRTLAGEISKSARLLEDGTFEIDKIPPKEYRFWIDSRWSPEVRPYFHQEIESVKVQGGGKATHLEIDLREKLKLYRFYISNKAGSVNQMEILPQDSPTHHVPKNPCRLDFLFPDSSKTFLFRAPGYLAIKGTFTPGEHFLFFIRAKK